VTISFKKIAEKSQLVKNKLRLPCNFSAAVVGSGLGYSSLVPSEFRVVFARISHKTKQKENESVMLREHNIWNAHRTHSQQKQWWQLDAPDQVHLPSVRRRRRRQRVQRQGLLQGHQEVSLLLCHVEAVRPQGKGVKSGRARNKSPIPLVRATARSRRRRKPRLDRAGQANPSRGIPALLGEQAS
jgi:hypothetical protein